MKIGVIGASGRLGTKVVRQALSRGHQVKAFIVVGEGIDEREEVIYKSLFDMTADDLLDVDVLISTFGSGFQADPVLNKQAYEKYIELMQQTGIRIVMIAGAGSLYSDETHTIREYERPDYYQKMYGISKNIFEGIQLLKNTSGLKWTAVCPSRFFDFEGPFTGNIIVGLDETCMVNEEGNSVVTYEDLAMGMLDCVETGAYEGKVVTFTTRKAY